MLIGVEKRYVFVANSKTASTSIEDALINHAEIHRGGAPQRKHIPLAEAIRTYGFLFDQPAYAPQTFFKFGVMRDPIGWIQSWFRYRKGNQTAAPLPAEMTFPEFWARKDWNLRLPDGSKRLQSRFFSDAEGRLIADYIIPYDAIETHFDLICTRLPQKNVSKIRASSEPPLPEALLEEMRAYYAEDYALLARLPEINAAGLARLPDAPAVIRKPGPGKGGKGKAGAQGAGKKAGKKVKAAP